VGSGELYRARQDIADAWGRRDKHDESVVE
jgi:hypothetical protein